MSDNIEPPAVAENPEPGVFEQPKFTGDLRALLKQRVEHKIRRIHKAWFCLDPQVQAELDAATAELAEMVGAEILKQQGQKRASKYAAPTRISLAEARHNALVEKSRQVGAMGVFQNLTDGQIEAVKAEEGSFLRAKSILVQSFLRWETADGAEVPADQFGAADLEMLLQPEVLEQGEWLPLASKIFTESATAVDRPTLPKS